MNVTIEEVNSIKRKLTVDLPEEEALKVRKKHLDAYARKARLKGFRPGKAPLKIVAQMFANELKHEVLEELVSNTVPGAISEHKLEPVGMPMLETVEYKEDVPIQFTFSVELKPVFDTPAWQGLELQKAAMIITPEMVDKKLEELRLSLSTVKNVEEDRPLEQGDLAVISYQGFDGDREVADMKAGPFNVELGGDRLTQEFQDGLTGMKAGETKDIPVTMPEDLEDKKLAGRHLTLRTNLSEIRRRELPALDDEFAKDLGLDGVDTLEALKEKINKDLNQTAADQADEAFNRQLTQILAKLVQIDVPGAMIEQEINAKVESMRERFQRNGLNFKKMGIDLGVLRGRLQPQAVISVTAALVLDQIGRDNGIEITDEDVEQELAEMSREYSQSVDAIREYYQSNKLMTHLREGLKVAKTLDLIKAQALIVDVDKIDPARLGYEVPAAAATGSGQAEAEDQNAPTAEDQTAPGPEDRPAE